VADSEAQPGRKACLSLPGKCLCEKEMGAEQLRSDGHLGSDAAEGAFPSAAIFSLDAKTCGWLHGTALTLYRLMRRGRDEHWANSGWKAERCASWARNTTEARCSASRL